MSKAKRRTITRADEAMVRERVARALGGDDHEVKLTFADGYCHLMRFRGILSDDAEKALAKVGITWAVDGWGIEDAPPIVAVAEIRHTLACKSAGRAGGESCECPGFPVRAGDEGPGVVDGEVQHTIACSVAGDDDGCDCADVPIADSAPPSSDRPARFAPVASTPVDREQAIRDALIERLTCSPLPTMDDLLNLLNGSGGRPMATSQEITDALASIGAVRDGDRWRLSDGPPHGWEWREGNDDALYLVPPGWTNLRADYIASLAPSGEAWRVCERDMDGRELAIGDGETAHECKAAALLARRRAGLFAPPVAAPRMADIPADDLDSIVPGGAQGVVVARARREAAAASPVQGPAVTLRGILDVVMGERTPFDGDALDGLCARFFDELDAAWDARMAGKSPVATTEPTDRHRDPVQTAASAMLQRDTIDPAWGALEARAVRAEQERDDARARVHDLERVILVRNNEVDHVTNCRDSARANAASWKARAEDAEGTVIAMRALLAKAAP